MRRYLQFFWFLLLLDIRAEEWTSYDYVQNELSRAEWLIQELHLSGNESILDVGCGDGKITALLAERIPHGHIIGIDPSRSMFERAEETLKQSELSNLQFYEGAAETFSLNESFDHIIAINVMHWVKEQAQALKNMQAHLKPHGCIHLILAASKEGLPFDKALQKTVQSWGDSFDGFVNSLQVFDLETYRKLLVEAGFHIQAIHYVYDETVYENKEKLITWIKQSLPQGKYLPLAKQAFFLNDLIDNYLTQLGFSIDTQNPIPWCEYIITVEARKAS